MVSREHLPKQLVQFVPRGEVLHLPRLTFLPTAALQVVPRAPHRQGGRETSDGEREARQLSGAGEPEQTGRLCAVGADKRG